MQPPCNAADSPEPNTYISSTTLSTSVARRLHPYQGYEPNTVVVSLVSDKYEKEGIVEQANELDRASFVPEGLFGIITSRILEHLQLRCTGTHLTRTSVTLCVGATKLVLQLLPAVGGIKITVDCQNPRAIVHAMYSHIQQVVVDHYSQLQCHLLLPYDGDSLIFFTNALVFYNSGEAFFVNRNHVKPLDFKKKFGQLLPLSLQGQCDVFLSYRQWVNSGFVMGLHSLLEQYEVITSFDAKYMGGRATVQLSVMKAMGRSLVACPVVSVGALRWMNELQHTDFCDNVLLEWMTMLALRDHIIRHRDERPRELIRLRRVVPLFLGPQRLNANSVSAGSSALYEGNSFTSMREMAQQLPDQVSKETMKALTLYFEHELELPAPEPRSIRNTVLSLFDIDAVTKIRTGTATNGTRNALLRRHAEAVCKAVDFARKAKQTPDQEPEQRGPQQLLVDIRDELWHLEKQQQTRLAMACNVPHRGLNGDRLLLKLESHRPPNHATPYLHKDSDLQPLLAVAQRVLGDTHEICHLIRQRQEALQRSKPAPSQSSQQQQQQRQLSPQPPTQSQQQSFDIFISLRFGEAQEQAEAIKDHLASRNISTFLCDVKPGDDMAKAVIHALHNCKMVVILGTKTYGKETASGFSTFNELRYILQQKKPFFLVKMCEEFEEVETKFRLTSDISYLSWLTDDGDTNLPDGLIDGIVEKLQSL